MHGFLVFLAIVIGLLTLFFGIANNKALREMLDRDARSRQAVAAAVASANTPDLPVNRGPAGFCKPA